MPVWAALGVALWLLGWGCLNPWPDDYPSNEGAGSTIEPPAVPSDDLECGEGNPLLQDCDDGESPPDRNVDSSDEPDQPSDPDSGADAGDAGAPDASVSANK